MTIKNEKKDDGEKTERRPYVKPDITSGQVFETMALSCGQGPAACAGNPDNS